MIKIGITGGIGSGKSIVCEILRLHNIPVFDADKEAKRLNYTSSVIREKLISLFGENLYKNNRLNRQRLAEIIFSNTENLQKVNAIIHPELEKHFAEWVKERAAFPIVAIDAALLFEARFDRFIDKAVTVYAPENLRIQRASVRDNASGKAIVARMKNQLPEEEKIARSNVVIYNDDHHSLIAQVEKMLENLKVYNRREPQGGFFI